MAIGLGACLGFTFPENFNYPYISASVSEFWRRWHITLSSWFREYVYIPLGGNRKGLSRQLVNILIVWALTGIWHGADISFLAWGLWFALLLILEKLFLGKVLSKLPKAFGRIYTCLAVLLGWVLFGLDSLSQAGGFFKALFGAEAACCLMDKGYIWEENICFYSPLRHWRNPFIGAILKKLEKNRTGYAIALYRLGEKVIPPLLLLLSVAYIVDASYNPFLYFRF